MTFSGTQDKCKACDKTVHFIDLLTADSIPYHKSCFRCSHCKGTFGYVLLTFALDAKHQVLAHSLRSELCVTHELMLDCTVSRCATTHSMDGVLYCKTHFEQLFKETGTFSKNFPTGAKANNDQSKVPNKLSSMFCGTQDKCAACMKTVPIGEDAYGSLIFSIPLEMTLEGEPYHKTCFKCAHGGCLLTTASYASLNGILYCQHHFWQLFKETGSYNNLLKAASAKNNDEPEAAVPAKADLEVEATKEEESREQAPEAVDD